MKIRLYQSASRTAEEMLALMLQRVLERQGKSLVRVSDKKNADSLSDFLWKRDGFIPHGIADGDTAEDQVIWIGYGDKTDNAISADILFLCDGLLPDLQGADGKFADVIIVFTKRNQEVIATMREFWKSLQAAPPSEAEEITYWHDEGGKWKKAGEIPSPTQEAKN